MVNENQLEDTNDSIIPVKNGLGVPSEIFSEILQEFIRACQSKHIDKNALINYMENKSSWQIKCVAIGAVTNVFISLGPDSDQHLNSMQNLGEDIVVDEIIRVVLDVSGTQQSNQRNLAKKSTQKLAQTKSGMVERKKDSQGNISKPLEYHSAKSGSNVWIMGVLVALSVTLAVVGFLLFKKSSNSKTANSGNLSTNQIPVAIVPKIPTESPKVVTETPKVNKTVEPKKEFPTLMPFAGNMIIPEGMLVYQSGYDSFIGGEIVTLYSNKRKNNTSPFKVSNHAGTAYTLLKYDLRNIPADANIENAILNLNVTTFNENNEPFILYCLPTNIDWTFNTIFFLKDGASSEISYEGLIKKLNTADKNSINMRNEWVSFNVTKVIQEWVSKKSINNGFALFTESNSDVVFEGFDSIKKMLSPKLVISFGSSAKPKEALKEPEKISDKEEPATNAVKDPKTKEANSKDNENALAKKEKTEEEINETNPLYKKFDKKETSEKVPDEKIDKKTTKNVFEEETEKLAKEEAANTKTPSAPANRIIEPIKEEGTVDVTMKEPIILPLTRLLDFNDLVKFENPENKGDLRYTLDGKDPTADSLIFGEPIKLIGNQLHIVKTAIYIDRVRKSPIKTHEFRVMNSQAQVIDNTSSNCKKSGNWEPSKSKASFYGKDYLWEQKGKGTVEWYPALSKKSICEVYIWIPDGDLVRPSQAKYVIKYDGGTKDVFVDQSKRGNKWIYLGSYPMKSGSCSITLQNDGTTKMFIADAACFYFTSE